MKQLSFIILLSALSLACNRQSATIDGRIEGAEGKLIFLEKVAIGKTTQIDSGKINTSGKFSFRIKNADPAIFYQLSVDSLNKLLFLAKGGEKIHLNAQAQNLVESSIISGSKDAELLLELQKNRKIVEQKLDSLLAVVPQDEDSQKGIRQGIARLFVRQKQYNTRFIVTHPSSPASIMAYYQRFDKNLPLFGTVDDRFLLRALIDSLRPQLPKSAYIKSLVAEMEKLEREAGQVSMHALLANAAVMDKPEIELEDVNGKIQRLSATTGKVVLLDFWASTNSISLMDNRELLPIYKEFHQKGFEVFQVSVDENAEQWRASVSAQALPWISVHCNTANGCLAAQNYVIQKLPANYIINRKGEVAGKNLYGDELKRKIKELL